MKKHLTREQLRAIHAKGYKPKGERFVTLRIPAGNVDRYKRLRGGMPEKSELYHGPDLSMHVSEDWKPEPEKKNKEMRGEISAPTKGLSVIHSPDGKYRFIGSIRETKLDEKRKKGFGTYQDALDAMKEYGYSLFGEKPKIPERRRKGESAHDFMARRTAAIPWERYSSENLHN